MGNKQAGHTKHGAAPSEPFTPIVRVERWEIPEKRYESGVIDFIIAQVPPPLTTPVAEYVEPQDYYDDRERRWRTGSVPQEVFDKIFAEADAKGIWGLSKADFGKDDFGYTITLLQPDPKHPEDPKKARFKELVVFYGDQSTQFEEEAIKVESKMPTVVQFFNFVKETLKECLSEDISAERRRVIMSHDFPDFIRDNTSYKRMMAKQ